MRVSTFFLFGITTATLSNAVNITGSLDGIYALVKRRIPSHANSFTFELVEGDGDSFTLADSKSNASQPTFGIDIKCTSVSACARGLYMYLTEFGNVDISWTDSQLDHLPKNLPHVGLPITASSVVSHRYYFNTVTFSYTTAFYDFDHWSLLLDWMALRGINLPLAWVGYESILVEVFQEIGLSEADISSFLSGPAFLAWNHFGNIHGSWGGNGTLPQQWIADQFALQKQLVKRMVELGMTPVLPAFTGFVPCQIMELFPNLNVVNGSAFSGFPSNFTNDCFMDPFEDLFGQMQKSFITKQIAAYGNVSHIYTLDQYNENDPASGDLDYLRNVSSNTFNSLRAADPQATMMIQAWLFFSDSAFWNLDRISAYLGGVEDQQGLLILDLYTEAQPQWQRTSSYFGRPWIWCALHDYGGNQGFEGYLTNLTVAPIEALNSPNTSMSGFGVTMEGQEGNEMIYDIFLDQAWSSSPLDIPSYVSSWVSRRYHTPDLPVTVQRAWSILSNTVYNNADPNTQATVKSILELAPALTGLTNRTGHHPTEIFYDTNSSIVDPLKLMVDASKECPALKGVPEFSYDVVDLGRQLLSNRFLEAYQNLVAVYQANGSTSDAVSAASRPMLTILSDLDTLLWTNNNFLLSNWIKAARSWAANSKDTQYANYLEYNARNQITLWGPDGEINDYASKQWAGLVGTYYLPRWTMFTTYLKNTTQTGQTFDSGVINAQLLAFGKQWDSEIWGQRSGETWVVRGDTWKTIDKILADYA